MLEDVLGYLRCPYCDGGLIRADGCLRCPHAHSFDIARQGYVSLLPTGPRRGSGDTAGMVRARLEFLALGHFAALADAISALAAGPASGATANTLPRKSGCVIDVGAGTGYYLAATLDRLPEHVGLALDVSKHALRHAARAHRRIGAVACDAWRRLPVADSVADVALNVFAPRDGAELRRVLRPAGRLLVVTPTADHLCELVEALGLLTVDQAKPGRLTAKLGPCFDLADSREHRAALRLDHAAISALIAMGPSAWHADPAAMASRIRGLPEATDVTVAVTLSVFVPRR